MLQRKTFGCQRTTSIYAFLINSQSPAARSQCPTTPTYTVHIGLLPHVCTTSQNQVFPSVALSASLQALTRIGRLHATFQVLESVLRDEDDDGQ